MQTARDNTLFYGRFSVRQFDHVSSHFKPVYTLTPYISNINFSSIFQSALNSPKWRCVTFRFIVTKFVRIYLFLISPQMLHVHVILLDFMTLIIFGNIGLKII
jgi:hypothetical protein